MNVVIVDFFGIVFAFIGVVLVDCELPPSATQDQSHRAGHNAENIARTLLSLLSLALCVHS